MTDDRSATADLEPQPPAGRGAFVWPPVTDAPPDARPPEPAHRPIEPAAKRPALEALRALEAFWLAPTSLPLSRRVEESGWAPDGFDVYCNRCGGDVGPGEEDEFGCARCRDWKHPWHRFVRLGAYEGEVAEWVKEVKFARNAPLGVALGRALAARLREAGLNAERLCVCPVGTSLLRRWSRGIDHAATIAEGVARGLDAPFVSALRRRHRSSQRRMPSRTAREANARGSFRPRSGVELGGWTVVLVDDVSTTGATLRAASGALRAGGGSGRPAAIWAATVGVTRDRGGRLGVPGGGEGGVATA